MMKYKSMNFARIAMLLLSGCALAQVPSGPPTGILDADNFAGSLIGIQYEQWFYGPQSWKTAEAVPILGKYTTDTATVTRHYEAFQQLGIDWLLIDWSNMLWAKPAWEQHAGETRRLEEKTAVLFQTAMQLHREGKYAPKLSGCRMDLRYPMELHG
jgi:hypothetical protein